MSSSVVALTCLSLFPKNSDQERLLFVLLCFGCVLFYVLMGLFLFCCVFVTSSVTVLCSMFQTFLLFLFRMLNMEAF